MKQVLLTLAMLTCYGIIFLLISGILIFMGSVALTILDAILRLV